jgi:metal-dependent amidase/aminoacylase/carboxypeptidase family protein
MTDLRQRVSEAVDRIDPMLRQVSRDIFEHPEIKHEETFASQRLAEELQAGGFAVELGVAGLSTAIRAVHPASSDGPTVAILGEYDALPDIGHACGHNLIAAGGLGAALAVGSVKDELPGTPRWTNLEP